MYVPLCLMSNFQMMKFGYCYANICKIHILKEHESYHRKNNAELMPFTLLSALGEDIYH